MQSPTITIGNTAPTLGLRPTQQKPPVPEGLLNPRQLLAKHLAQPKSPWDLVRNK